MLNFGGVLYSNTADQCNFFRDGGDRCDKTWTFRRLNHELRGGLMGFLHLLPFLSMSLLKLRICWGQIGTSTCKDRHQIKSATSSGSTWVLLPHFIMFLTSSKTNSSRLKNGLEKDPFPPLLAASNNVPFVRFWECAHVHMFLTTQVSLLPSFARTHGYQSQKLKLIDMGELSLRIAGRNQCFRAEYQSNWCVPYAPIHSASGSGVAGFMRLAASNTQPHKRYFKEHCSWKNS